MGVTLVVCTVMHWCRYFIALYLRHTRPLRTNSFDNRSATAITNSGTRYSVGLQCEELLNRLITPSPDFVCTPVTQDNTFSQTTHMP